MIRWLRRAVLVQWVPAAKPVEHFTGRVEQLARLDRWAADPQVALVGVTAWGGAGKTALVTHWVHRQGGYTRRSGIRGVFAWSFYADPSAEHWATALLEWAQRDLGITVNRTGCAASEVRALLRTVPLAPVMDGLEKARPDRHWPTTLWHLARGADLTPARTRTSASSC